MQKGHWLGRQCLWEQLCWSRIPAEFQVGWHWVQNLNGFLCFTLRRYAYFLIYLGQCWFAFEQLPDPAALKGESSCAAEGHLPQQENAPRCIKSYQAKPKLCNFIWQNSSWRLWLSSRKENAESKWNKGNLGSNNGTIIPLEFVWSTIVNMQFVSVWTWDAQGMQDQTPYNEGIIYTHYPHNEMLSPLGGKHSCFLKAALL